MKKVVAAVGLVTNIGAMCACCILVSIGVTSPVPTMIIFMVVAFFTPASVDYFNDKIYKDHSDSKG